MKTMKSTLILCTILLTLQRLPAETKRVVQIPVLTPSHARYHANTARALHSLGHQVWLVAPDFLLEKGIIDHDVSNISIIPYQVAQNYHEMILDMLVEAYFLKKAADEQIMHFLAMKLCDELMLNRELESKIRELQPDLIVLDNTPNMYCAMVLPYKLQVPFAMMGVMYDVRNMRIPYSSAVDAFQLDSTWSDDMEFFQRVKSMVFHLLQFVYDPFLPRNIVSLYAPERPYIASYELTARAEIWLVDMDHIMDYPRPLLPNVKLIGGPVTDHPKPLPPKLQAFMDSATEGVVVVTFGGSVLGIPKRISDKLFEVFRDIPYKVVFRSNLTSPDPAKVWISTWLPQNDMLGHPNTKVFLSHCGNHGQYEALFHAVPLLCNPIFADQGYNSERI